MAQELSRNQVTGIVLIVVGVLAIAGYLNGLLVTLAGVALLVVGILILLGKLRGTQLVGILCIVGAIVLLAGLFHLDDLLRRILEVVTIVVGIVLVVYGILKLVGK